MPKRIIKIIKNILYIAIVIILILVHNNHNKKINNNLISLNYFKITKAIEKNDKKTITYLAKKIIKLNKRNIYYDASCIILYEKNKKNLDKALSKNYLNKIIKNKNSIFYQKAKKHLIKLQNKYKNAKKISITK